MTSGSVVVYQAIATAVIAALVVWSTYRGGERVYVNNKWFPWLKRLPDKINLGIRVFLVFGAMFIVADSVWLLEPHLREAYAYCLAKLGLQGTQIGAGVIVVVVGFYAYWFKVKHQLAYGMVEIIFAGAAGVVTARQMSTATQWAGSVATLIGAVYVVSRGVGNVAEGLRKAGLLSP